MEYQKFLPRFIKRHIAKAQRRKQEKELAMQRLQEIQAFDTKIRAFLDSDTSSKSDIYIPVIVSLTSYPKRISHIQYTLYSLLTQTIKPKRLILWLSTQEFPNKEQDIPKLVLDFQKKGLEIIWCETNLRPYNKLIHTLEHFPNQCIITADDDIVYKESWLERLYTAYTKAPHLIHCHRAHKILFDERGEILPYGQWRNEISYQETNPSFVNFPTGVGGVLYPPNCFYKDILRADIFMQLCPIADDIWFWAMLVLNDKKINVVLDNMPHLCDSYMDKQETGALEFQNRIAGKNDEWLANVFAHYPELHQKLRAIWLKFR